MPNLEYKGYRLLAVDGSNVRLPADSHNAETYIKTNKTDAKGYNLVHLDAMFDLISHTYVDASIQPKRNMSEHRALTTMIDRSTISNPAIIIADRGYEFFNNMAHIIKKGWYFVIRAKNSYGIITKTSVPDCPEFDVPVNVTLTRRKTKLTRMLFNQDPYRPLPANLKMFVLILPLHFCGAGNSLCCSFFCKHLKKSRCNDKLLLQRDHFVVNLMTLS